MSEDRQPRRVDDDQSDPPLVIVLLIPDVLVAREHDLEPSFFTSAEQIAILEFVPKHLFRREDLEVRQQWFEMFRNVVVQQNLQALAFICLTSANAMISRTASRSLP